MNKTDSHLNSQTQSTEEESFVHIQKDFHSEPQPQKPLPEYLKKIKDKLQDINIPHHIKLDTIFDTVKDAHSIFAIEKKTYDFVLNLNKMLIAIIVALCILIICLFPLKEKEPYLVGFSNATQNFVHIEKANETITANEALLRNLIGSYIINRETINHFDDEERYEVIRMQSSHKVWRVFENIVAQESSIYGNSNLTREVKIVNVAKWKDGYANAEVGISLYALGELQSQKRYRITLMYKFNTLDIDFESVPKNPTGFEVQEYAVTEIATIKELDEENKVNPNQSKSKIKTNSNALKTDSNEFLKEAYQFKEKKAKEVSKEHTYKGMSDEEYLKLNASEKKKALAEEIKAMKKFQDEQIINKEDSVENENTANSGSKSPNPFLD